MWSSFWQHTDWLQGKCSNQTCNDICGTEHANPIRNDLYFSGINQWTLKKMFFKRCFWQFILPIFWQNMPIFWKEDTHLLTTYTNLSIAYIELLSKPGSFVDKTGENLICLFMWYEKRRQFLSRVDIIKAPNNNVCVDGCHKRQTEQG